MNCAPVSIRISDDAKPYAVHAARKIPFPLFDKVRKEEQRMLQLGVIREVTQPTPWVAPIVVVEKPDGSVRLCVDLRKLNKSVLRERYILPTADDVLHRLSGSKVFTKLDASSGYWAHPLSEESQLLTTFLTPSGRYCFRRLPFGITSASEIFQREMSKLLSGVDNVEVFQDDVLVHGSSMDEHNVALNEVLRRMQQSGLKLNKRKCLFRQPEIVFLGHKITQDGISPDPAKVEAINELPEPTDVCSLRRFCGMVNYLGRYIPNLSDRMEPLNASLRSDVSWHWSSAQSTAFVNIKAVLTSGQVLAHYDVSLPTVVSADASSYGIGGVVLQQHPIGPRPVAFCSRTLTPAEVNYAQIEKECLSIVWTCERMDRFLQGLSSFTVQTDHKPLVPLINTRDLDKVPVRCQRLLMRLMRFNPVAVHVPGKTLVIADTLSRQPLHNVENSSCDEVEMYVASIIDNLPMTKPKLYQYQRETASDENLQLVCRYNSDGWPRYVDQVPKSVNPYYEIRGELSMCDGLILKGTGIVVPETLHWGVITLCVTWRARRKLE